MLPSPLDSLSPQATRAPSSFGSGASRTPPHQREGIIRDIDIPVTSARIRSRRKDRGGGQGRRRDRRRGPRHDGALGYLYISPWIIGLVIFTGIPIIASLVLSFTTYDVLRPERIRFVGLANYRWALSDPGTLTSIAVTIKFALITTPMTIGLALATALLVHHRLLLGKRVFRTLFFMPAQFPSRPAS